jgi:hypothetical protein
MKFLTLLLSLTILYACGTASKIQGVKEVAVKADTTHKIVVSDIKTPEPKNVKQDTYNRIIANNIDFKTFNAKVRVEFEGKEGKDEATAYIRLKKDSLLWLSLRGPLGIEGFRVLITKDSITIMELQKKTVMYRSIKYLPDLTDLPLNFAALQDLIIGNPIFIDSNIISQQNNNDELLVQMNGAFFKNLLTLSKDYKVLHSKLDDVNTVRNSNCTITFSNYDNTTSTSFSTGRKIVVTSPSQLSVNLDFKQYTFNVPLTFPFSIPKNYKKL